jgi:phosphate starvation-inducible PhoH-like protein
MSKKLKVSLRKEFRPRNSFQEKIVKALRTQDIILAEGPAGVGKTYASVALAVKYLAEGKVDKIIITRPIVTADEDIGYLPGTAEEKIDPYMRPLFDAFSDLMEPDQFFKYVELDIIEVAPIGFMRGRTFSNCFVIVDESQNATKQQMKMLLTRVGDNVKYILQGDSSQSDLNGNNGLKWAMEKLSDCPVVEVIKGSQKEVVRSELLKELLKYIM